MYLILIASLPGNYHNVLITHFCQQMQKQIQELSPQLNGAELLFEIRLSLELVHFTLQVCPLQTSHLTRTLSTITPVTSKFLCGLSLLYICSKLITPLAQASSLQLHIPSGTALCWPLETKKWSMCVVVLLFLSLAGSRASLCGVWSVCEPGRRLGCHQRNGSKFLKGGMTVLTFKNEIPLIPACTTAF